MSDSHTGTFVSKTDLGPSRDALRTLAAAHRVVVTFHPVAHQLRDHYTHVPRMIAFLDALDNLERALVKLAES